MTFPELSEDAASDPIWVSMRNPRLMPSGALRQADVPVGDDGKPIDLDAAERAMHERLAKVIIGARAYDATTIDIDPNTGEELPQELLTGPFTADVVARLPMAIINRMAEEFTAALEPPKSSQGNHSSRMSTPSPSPGSTGPGRAEPSPTS